MMNTVKIIERGDKTVYQIVNIETDEVVFEVYLHDDTEQIHLETKIDVYDGPIDLIFKY